MDSMGSTRDLMAGMLEVAVPLRIMELKDRGGPDERDMERCKQFSEDVSGPGGEDLLFKSKKPGHTAELFNELARVVACLSFVPGGVTFMGRHWESIAPRMYTPIIPPR